MDGQDSSVCIASRYWPDTPRFESRWEQGFPYRSRPAPMLTQTPVQWVPGLFPGGKTARAWCWPPTLWRPGWRMEQSFTSTPLYAFKACYRVNFPYLYYEFDGNWNGVLSYTANDYLVVGNTTYGFHSDTQVWLISMCVYVCVCGGEEMH